MSTLLMRPDDVAEAQTIADGLALAAERVVPAPELLQVSRRELLQRPAAAPGTDDAPLREPEPDLELQRLGRYIAWRCSGTVAFGGQYRGSPAARAARGYGPRLGPAPLHLRDAEARYATLAPLARTPRRWPTLDDETFVRLAFRRLVTEDCNSVYGDPTLNGMYPTLVARLPQDQRLQLLTDVAFTIETSPRSIGTLLPFLHSEPSSALTAYAAFLCPQRAHVRRDDPMGGVRAVVALATSFAAEQSDRSQAILTGLLALGDGRTIALLEDCWRLFPADEKGTLTYALFAPVTAAHLEWALRWMEDGADDDLGFGARTIVNAAARGGDVPVIRDLHWHLPIPRVDHPDDPAWQYPCTVLQTWTFPQYAAILEPRLRRILLREQTEPVTPYVLLAWGLDPGEWDEIDQLRRIGERYLAHVEALRRLAETPTGDASQAWAWSRIADAVGEARPLVGLARLLALVTRMVPDPRWVALEPNQPPGGGDAAIIRVRIDAARRILRAQFGPNLFAALSDLALLERRWTELGLTGGF